MHGQLIKITSTKKLLVKVDEPTFLQIGKKLLRELRDLGYSMDRTAIWETEDGTFFVNLTLDQYDRLNLRKFEGMLKSHIDFNFKHKPFDFVPHGQDEPVMGIHLLMTTIRRANRRAPIVVAASSDTPLDEVLRAIDSQNVHWVGKNGTSMPMPIPCPPPSRSMSVHDEDSSCSEDEDEDDVDRMLAQRLANAKEPLDPLERHIDAHVEAAAMSSLPPGPPKLIRQSGRRQAWA